MRTEQAKTYIPHSFLPHRFRTLGFVCVCLSLSSSASSLSLRHSLALSLLLYPSPPLSNGNIIHLHPSTERALEGRKKETARRPFLPSKTLSLSLSLSLAGHVVIKFIQDTSYMLTAGRPLEGPDTHTHTLPTHTLIALLGTCHA